MSATITEGPPKKQSCGGESAANLDEQNQLTINYIHSTGCCGLQVATAEINRLHNEICGAIQENLNKAIRVGVLLTEQKATLNHGQWLPWLTANVSFEPRTAQRYMSVFKNREKLKYDTLSFLTDAYKLIETPKPAILLETSNIEDEEDIKEGKRLQHEVWKLKVQWEALLAETERWEYSDVERLAAYISDCKVVNERAVRYTIHCERKLGEILNENPELLKGLK
jgi:hypothetical protein